MKSLSFPTMIKGNSTQVNVDHEATITNLKLLLESSKRELFGDPYFGTNLKRLFFEQNDIVLQDLVIDDIYTAIIQFIPQIRIQRKDIVLVSTNNELYAKIKALNLIDYTTDLYTIKLMEYEVR